MFYKNPNLNTVCCSSYIVFIAKWWHMRIIELCCRVSVVSVFFRKIIFSLFIDYPSAKCFSANCIQIIQKFNKKNKFLLIIGLFSSQLNQVFSQRWLLMCKISRKLKDILTTDEREKSIRTNKVMKILFESFFSHPLPVE